MKAAVVKYNGPAGETVGNAGFAASLVRWRLSSAIDGRRRLAYQNRDQKNKNFSSINKPTFGA